MPVHSSANRYPLDTLLELRSASAGPVSDNTETAVVELGVLDSYWDSGLPATSHQIAVVLNVSDLDTSDGQTYVIDVGIDSSADLPDPTYIDYREIVSTGRHLFVFTREELAAHVGETGYIFFSVGVGMNPTKQATITFSANPQNGDKIEFDDGTGFPMGGSVTFGSLGGEVEIGADANETAANVADFMTNAGTGLTATAVLNVVTIETFTSGLTITDPVDAGGVISFTPFVAIGVPPSITFSAYLAPMIGGG